MPHTVNIFCIDGYAKAASLKKTYEEMGAYVLLMDAGDFTQGDPTVSTSEGATAVELMNLADYDVAAPGNHEFDYGYANLKDLADEADFPIVAANVLYGGTSYLGKVLPQFHLPKNTDWKEQKSVRRFPY